LKHGSEGRGSSAFIIDPDRDCQEYAEQMSMSNGVKIPSPLRKISYKFRHEESLSFSINSKRHSDSNGSDLSQVEISDNIDSQDSEDDDPENLTGSDLIKRHNLIFHRRVTPISSRLPSQYNTEPSTVQNHSN